MQHLNELTSVLRSFYEATVILCAQRYPSISVIKPDFRSLRTSLEIKKNDSNAV